MTLTADPQERARKYALQCEAEYAVIVFQKALKEANDPRHYSVMEYKYVEELFYIYREKVRYYQRQLAL